MGLVYESLELSEDGIKNAAYNSKISDDACFKLSDYSYLKESSTACGNDLYLKGVYSGDLNAMGQSYQYSYWGRALTNINTSLGIEYYSAFGHTDTESIKLPFVYKNYGLIPNKETSLLATQPFQVQSRVILNTYLKYDRNQDVCFTNPYSSTASVSDEFSFVINDGPGIFFIMTGGGGGGASPGAGGGGGGSALCYLDLRMCSRAVYFQCGSGGRAGLNGQASSLSLCYSNTSIDTMLVCAGGNSPVNGNGGVGGSVSLFDGVFQSRYFYIIQKSNGLTGGVASATSPKAGGSFAVNTYRYDLNPLKWKEKPYLSNGTYGTGTPGYGYGTYAVCGGGGGASLLSTGVTDSKGYGTGGHGGGYNGSSAYSQGDAGQSGVLEILKLF